MLLYDITQSESIASSELRMSHLFIQKYLNNSLILNIKIADTYLFNLHAIYFFTSLKNTSCCYYSTMFLEDRRLLNKICHPQRMRLWQCSPLNISI